MSYQKIRLIGNAIVTFDDSQTSKCRRCGKTIWWGVTKNAKAMPICKDVNGAWISHFTDCVNHKKHDDLLDDLTMQKKRDGWA